jgi:hypothetical protein
VLSAADYSVVVTCMDSSAVSGPSERLRPRVFVAVRNVVKVAQVSSPIGLATPLISLKSAQSLDQPEWPLLL